MLGLGSDTAELFLHSYGQHYILHCTHYTEMPYVQNFSFRKQPSGIAASFIFFLSKEKDQFICKLKPTVGLTANFKYTDTKECVVPF